MKQWKVVTYMDARLEPYRTLGDFGSQTIIVESVPVPVAGFSEYRLPTISSRSAAVFPSVQVTSARVNIPGGISALIKSRILMVPGLYISGRAPAP